MLPSVILTPTLTVSPTYISGNCFFNCSRSNSFIKFDELKLFFGWDIDFVFDVRVGENVKVLYTEFYLEGRLLGNSDILAATFINNGKEFSVFRFSQQGVKDYFSADGESVKKSFLKTPIEFAAITSPYNLKRKHPILNTIRPHTGTDYRGKTGTPVKVTGDGIVIRANFSNSYGNIIDVKPM